MNSPMPQSMMLELEPAEISPSQGARVLIDHSKDGGPILDVTESLAQIDALAPDRATGSQKKKPAKLANGECECWIIPPQDKIEICNFGGSVLIEQIDSYGETQSVYVQRENAVGFARRALWAAGFNAVLIAHSPVGQVGWVDLEDGALAEDDAEEEAMA